jgi:Bacterial extracellular solute-binding protein
MSGCRTGWSLGENVSQAAPFAESGNAQVGFVALAHAIAPAMRGKGKYWEVPEEYYPALAQGVVVLAHSQHKKLGGVFGVHEGERGGGVAVQTRVRTAIITRFWSRISVGC